MPLPTRTSPPAHPDVSPCPSGHFPLPTRTSAPAHLDTDNLCKGYLCQRGVKSRAHSSTAHSWTSEFQTGGFSKEKAWAYAANLKTLSDLLLRTDRTTPSPGNFQHTPSFWSETNGHQSPDRATTRSWRADKLWAVRQKASGHLIQSFTGFLSKVLWFSVSSPVSYRDDGLSVLDTAAAIRQAPSRALSWASAQTSGQDHLLVIACSPGSGGKTNLNLKPLPSKMELQSPVACLSSKRPTVCVTTY